MKIDGIGLRAKVSIIDRLNMAEGLHRQSCSAELPFLLSSGSGPESTMFGA